MQEKPKKLLSVDLGRTDYKSAWDLQKKTVELRQAGNIPSVLLFTEHDPVITLGRASSLRNLLCSPEELRNKGIGLFEIERGGDITFHGPGQLVVYPIVDLSSHGRDLRKYLRDLEKVIIAVLKEYGINAGAKEGLTGVWAHDYKLAAIGVAVSRWITYHGAALNVNTDLDYFKLIHPCGITEYPVGSMKMLLGKEINLNEVKQRVERRFAEVFGYIIELVDSIDSVISEPARCE